MERVIRSRDFVPSHYYFEYKTWEDRAFVDTGFCVEDFQKFDEVTLDDRYTELIDTAMRRYIQQFKLDNGFYGQNYIPGQGVDFNLFSRGQAWALEGYGGIASRSINSGITGLPFLSSDKGAFSKWVELEDHEVRPSASTMRYSQ